MIKLHWSRAPEKFLNPRTGKEIAINIKFDSTVREWYETLLEVIRDATTLAGLDQLREVSLRVSPNAHVILQSSIRYKVMPTSLSYMDTTYRITEDKKMPRGCDIVIEDFNFYNKR